MSFLDSDNNDLTYETLAATYRPTSSSGPARHVIMSKEDEREHVELRDSTADIKVAVDGTNFKIIQENGRVIVEPQDSSRVVTWSVLFKNLEIEDQNEDVTTDGGVTIAKDVTSEQVTSPDVTSETTSDIDTIAEALALPGYEIRWKVMTPFTNKNIKNKKSYLVPQLLAIDIRPRVEDGVWKVPKAVIICSTRPALGAAKSKVEQVLRKLKADGQDPESQVSPICPLITGELGEQHVPKLKNGKQPVLVCTPRYAKHFVRQNIEQVWWLNVRQLDQHWTDIDELLEVFDELDGSLRSPLKVNVCFGWEDRKEAAHVLDWLEKTKGASQVKGFYHASSDLEL